MEKSLEKHLEETFKIPGVSGIICTDEQGLCLASKGVSNSNCSGSIASVAQQAEHLRKTSNSPSIYIESENGNLLIGRRENITMAIFKSD
ncbi:hypothetical protein LOTGIDRAFT_205042 [Lottia gigantea]|uniref:Late endosomal/lysosomal adaptor and MAPK and MTOR activator 5 n=1 Tax=Lottia gigantea TaxID=225164 RepID=V4AHL4_LOTGI|nr:hypothetical protein LOTGIDRAFT_205042 [Lottia gigantea]ESP03554.1 hypothetical protein LOTGIDRAFT_205042 [Lottia gigantea]